MCGDALGSRLILIVLPFFCGRLAALEPSHNLTQYAHASWTRQGGQLAGAVFSLAQTRDGTLWVGTDYGLVRFDGVRFLPWTPPSGQQPTNELISALAASRDGTLWIGTRFGLSHSNGTRIDQYQARNGGQVLGVTAIVEDHDGKVWVGTNGYGAGGVCGVKTDRLHCYGTADGLPNAGVYSLLEDHAGNLWVGGVGGLYRWRPGAPEVYSLHRPPEQIRSIAASERDEIWVATGSQGGIEHLVNGELAASILTQAGQTLQPREVLSDRDGGLWVGTWGQGLIHIYRGRIDRLTHAEGLSGDTVHRLFEDREGNIWVATDSGLDRFRDFEVTTISKRDGLSQDTVDSVCASKDGSVWIGSADGLNRIQDGKIVVYGKRDGLPSGNIRSIFEEKSGRIWVNSSAGLARFEQGRFTRLDSPIARKIRVVTAAAEGSDHCVWFSDAEQGLVRFCEAGAADVLPSSQFGNKQAWALEADVSDGGLWLGFSQGGIAYYKPGQAIRQYTTADGLAAGAVRDFHLASGGTLWIATEGGLSRLSKNHIATLTAAKGLPCDRIHAIVSDETGALSG